MSSRAAAEATTHASDRASGRLEEIVSTSSTQADGSARRTLNAHTVRHMLLAVCAEMISAEDMLCAADRAVGDGDHGIGMRRGFKAAQAALKDTAAQDERPPVAILDAMGRALIGEMGGASGVMFGLMFTRPRTPAATPISRLPSLLTVEAFAAHLRAAAETVMARGGARPGDMTMVDALIPAVEALEAAAAARADWPDALSAAARKAHEGAEATREMTARFGKARTLGDRALGHRDPGAISVSLIFAAMAQLITAAPPAPDSDSWNCGKNHDEKAANTDGADVYSTGNRDRHSQQAADDGGVR
jgi:phosphoenolpyruvate---glycerone phosphotransferase subunit DhaL